MYNTKYPDPCGIPTLMIIMTMAINLAALEFGGDRFRRSDEIEVKCYAQNFRISPNNEGGG